MGYFHSIFSKEKKSLITKQIAAAIGLSLLFIIVYGTCNWITSLRTDVGTLYFNWERLMPFIPIMIVPYMSIDLFFLGAPFLCRNSRELTVFSQRVIAAILIAGGFFLIMPLKFAFARPVVTGWLGPIYQLLYVFDHPYNLFPSLHITLRTILAYLYASKTKGFLRILVHIWFSLIGFSTVFTYQHHVLDVVGGFILAAFIFYLFREKKQAKIQAGNFRVGTYYLLGSIVSVMLAYLVWPWGVIFLWPGISCGIITFGYFGMGPVIYKKESGKLPLSSKVILLPCVLGQYVSLLYYKKACNPWDEVVKGVYIGRMLNSQEVKQVLNQGVCAVVDLTAEFSEQKDFISQNYINIQILDLTPPTQDQIRTAVNFIDHFSKKCTVYIHCKIGYSRTAVITGAFLIKAGYAKTVNEAISLMRNFRPTLVVRKEARKVLEEFVAFGVYT
ncbi:MAG: phosphatase PAP2/dual specificity phosphatase family protein [bacterium]